MKGDIIDGADEMFFLFNSKDEREPHAFIMEDSFFVNGLVKEW